MLLISSPLYMFQFLVWNLQLLLIVMMFFNFCFKVFQLLLGKCMNSFIYVYIWNIKSWLFFFWCLKSNIELAALRVFPYVGKYLSMGDLTGIILTRKDSSSFSVKLADFAMSHKSITLGSSNSKQIHITKWKFGHNAFMQDKHAVTPNNILLIDLLR